MSYHLDHSHLANVRAQFRAGQSPQYYAAVVGTLVKDSEQPVFGRNGDHLQFYVDIGGGNRFQVDVNTQSRDGSEIEVYVASQDVNPSGTNPTQPFGAPAYGVFTDAQLSYGAMGLNDNDFDQIPYFRFDNLLQAKLEAAAFVSIYGMAFDDGGPTGKGIHEIHYNPGETDQDGAVLIYSTDPSTGNPLRTWFFCKFAEDNL